MTEHTTTDHQFAVDLVRNDGSSSRYFPGPLAAQELPREAFPEHVAWSRTNLQTGTELIALAAPDSPANRDTLRNHGWVPATESSSP